ncbi:hypothetical protein SAMD00019534_026640 [Acytostelium subglobosum LB1]|uniref:hypothetical protein n=1 Tax=Acytostelium subglobosum LB1 TaxID=1410327 RepID=UPI0006449B2F|nr:hypothetical protein SAMD00019534_026640 [Acytostelium subglobosum LB1]GAM19489.1 hypothetical protein SAMD00019534_026640 [Acytostelium subglobosum LB1]|eukprot:XP_012757416.1 hypothetical protein SAMD00019534_026640 [Acytostelium subglobosum LB1]
MKKGAKFDWTEEDDQLFNHLKRKSDGSVVAAQVTMATNPSYSFNHVLAGDYCMSASIPTGYERVAVTSDYNSFNIDDSDVRTDEPFLANIDFSLKFKNGTLVNTQTTTANNPGYQFNNLFAGDYCMSTTLPAPSQFFNHLTVLNNDNSFDANNNFCFTLGADKTVNVGFRRKIFVLSAFVWDDINKDNVFNAPVDHYFTDQVISVTVEGAKGDSVTITPSATGGDFNLYYGGYCVSSTIHPGYQRVPVLNQDNTLDNNKYCFTLTADTRINIGFQKL